MSKRTPQTDKELWRSLSPDRGAVPSTVSDLDFAAWLEGRLPEAAADQVEAAVAADPELRRAALDLADVLGKPLPAAPVRMAVRAQALVGFDAERQVKRGGFISRLFFYGTPYALKQAAMAATVLVVASVGFMVGGGLGDSYAQEKYGSSQTTSSYSYTTNELDLFSDGI
jgi:hypothetical protein